MMLGTPEANPDYVTTQVLDGVLEIRMCATQEKNSLSPTMVSALLHAVESARDASVRVMVLMGTQEVFCSGASYEVLESLIEAKIAPSELGLARIFLTCPVPVIAACRGWAVGGGFTLALAADMVILAKQHRYGFNFMELGITPGMGTTALASQFLGDAVANELMYSGELRRGAQMATLGFNAVLDSEQVEDRALEMAWRIASKQRKNLELLKASLVADRIARFDAAILREAEMHGETLATLDLSNFGGSRV